MTLAVRYFWLGLRRGQFRWLWLAILLASLSVTFIEQLAQTVKASSHEVLIDPILAAQWSLQVGDTLALGNRIFHVQGILAEADSLQTVASQFAPQVIIPLNVSAELGLTSVGSRISYERLFASDETRIKQLMQQLNRQTPTEWQLISSQTASEDLNQTLNTAWLFLDITALVSLLVAGLAVLIASRFYLPQWRKQLAIMRALGMTQGQLARLFAGQLTLLALFASSLATLTSALMSVYWLKIPVSFSPSLWLVGLVVSSSSLLLMAWLTQSSYLRMHPRQLAQAIGD